MGRAGSLAMAALLCSCNSDVVVGAVGDGGSGGSPTAIPTSTSKSGGGSGGDVMVYPGGAPPARGSGGADACGQMTSAAERTVVPLDIYVMLQQSQSMNEALPAPDTGTWWTAAQVALTRFGTTAEAAGWNVGLQYFPLNGTSPDSCMAPYSTPEVAMGTLPTNASALTASLGAHRPGGSAPTGPALAGALSFMKDRARSTGAPGAVVLVSDGTATECEPQASADLAELAREAYETEPTVRTFVIGLHGGAGSAALGAIAKAGGTRDVVPVDGLDPSRRLLTALLMLDATQPVCHFDIPEPNMGPSEPDLVSIIYTAMGTDESVEIKRLKRAEDCALNNDEGWYFDDNAAPRKITLCGKSCSKTTGGQTAVRFGCRPSYGNTL